MHASLVNREAYFNFELLTTVDEEAFIDMVHNCVSNVYAIFILVLFGPVFSRDDCYTKKYIK